MFQIYIHSLLKLTLSMIKISIGFIPVLLFFLINTIIDKKPMNKSFHDHMVTLARSHILFLTLIIVLSDIATFTGIPLKAVYRISYMLLWLIFIVVMYIFVRKGYFRKIRILKIIRNIFIIIQLFFVIYILCYISWTRAFDTHPIDEGIHIFWSLYAYENGKIPDYSIVEPLDQSSKFVYGAHVLLAYLYSIHMNPYNDIKAFEIIIVIYYIMILFSLIYLISRNSILSLFSIIAYIFHYISGGYIQRGNIPDIVGMSILVSMIYMLIYYLTFDKKLRLNTIIFTGLSTITLSTYHPYHLISFVIIVMSYIGLCIIAKIVRNLKYHSINIYCHKCHNNVRLKLFNIRLFILIIIVLLYAFLSFPFLPYVHKGMSEVGKIKWILYVPSFDSIKRILGLYFVLSLPLSIIMVMLYIVLKILKNGERKKSLETEIEGYTIVALWFLTMLLLSQAPRFGIGIEPSRFVWRALEPSIVLSAIGLNLSTQVVKVKKKHLKIAINVLLITGVVLPSILVHPNIFNFNRYYVYEPYINYDIIIGKYINMHFKPNNVVLINNADIDRTATYIQAYALVPRTLYKVDFAINIAPYPYNNTYYILHEIYSGNLDDFKVYKKLEYLRNAYNVTTILLVYYNKEKYYWSINKHIYSKLLEFSDERHNIWISLLKIRKINTNINLTYRGWHLHLENKGDALLLRELNITIVNNTKVKVLHFNIYPQIVRTKDGKLLNDKVTVYIYLDNTLYKKIKFNLTTTIIDKFLDFELYWPNLRGYIGSPKEITLVIPVGTHTVTIKAMSPLSYVITLNSIKEVNAFITRVP